MNPSRVTAVILAGGKARRLGGTPKGLLRLGERTLAERIVEVSRAVAGRLLIVTDEPGAYASLGIPAIPDQIPGLGPIGGLQAALACIETPHALVIGCDMPRVSAAVLARIRDRPEAFAAVVPRVAARRHPLCARYSRNILPIVNACITQGVYRMGDLLERLVVDEIEEEALLDVDPDLDSFCNVNTPEDAERFGVTR